jgi:hypothetical protein
MSEIPFVKQLGDAIERSAAAHIAGRRRRIRRRLTGGVLAFAVAASGVAAASGLFESGTPEQLASAGIGCYDRASFHDANVTVLSTGVSTPIETCRRVLHIKGPMVACAGQAVLVFPGEAGTCEKLGFKPLGPEYFATRRRVNALNRELQRVEASVDCWEPYELSRRVRRLLERTPGWSGWTTRVDRAMAEGPCGMVSQPDGTGAWTVDGVLDTQTHTVIVMQGPARSTLELLDQLDDLAVASTARCYDRAGAEALARERLAASGRTVTFHIEHLDGGSVDAFQDRIDEGCSVIPGFSPADDGYGIVVTIRE